MLTPETDRETGRGIRRNVRLGGREFLLFWQEPVGCLSKLLISSCEKPSSCRAQGSR